MAHSGALLSSAANTPARTCSPVGSRARAGRLSALPNWPFGSQQQDKLCKDMVNERKDLTGVEGSAKVTFLGAKGQEFTVDNPLVSDNRLDFLFRSCLMA